MTGHDTLFKMSVVDWENFLLNRSKTREIPGHGGGTPLDITLRHVTSREDGVEIYSRIVQAVLNSWTELEAVERDEWEFDPITLVARAPFHSREGATYFCEDLRPYYNRLWQESPRPHSDTHKFIALNSNKELPVTRAEIGLLFELDGWCLIAARMAGLNDAMIMMEDLVANKAGRLTPSFFDSMVMLGLPKHKALRWMTLLELDKKSDYGATLMERLQQECAEEGMSTKDIYG